MSDGVIETMVTLRLPLSKPEGVFFNLSKNQNVEVVSELGLSHRYKLEPGDYHARMVMDGGEPRIICVKNERK